jgi:glycosyltransferase involved in cell wall biosynthesis
VGWTGDPHRSFKGFYDFVVPAVEKAASLRPGIVLKTRFKGPYRTLHRFYQDVDVLLIASTGDAGPSSFLEAGACGVPSISTRIGFPAEAIRDGENGIFVDRSVEEMSGAIVSLYDNQELLRKMSSSIRADIEKYWNPASRSGLWDHMFQAVLADAKAG